MVLTVLPGTFAVCRLAADAAVPLWARGAFVSVTRTVEELSVLCEAAGVPPDVRSEGAWRALSVAGPLAFEEIGVLAGLAAPLAEAGVSIFVVSTFDTDYVLVKSARLAAARTALEAAGYTVRESEA